MHSRPSLVDGVIFGAPLAVVAGLLTHFEIPFPQWLTGPAEVRSHMEPESIVYVCRCPEHGMRWPDVFRFIASQLAELTHAGWVPLILNIALVLQTLLVLGKLLRKSYSREMTQLPNSALCDQTDADGQSIDISPYGPRERALLQFEKLRHKKLNFKYCNEDSWILEEDFLLPAGVVKPLLKQHGPGAMFSDLSPSTVVASVGVQTAISQRSLSLPQSDELPVDNSTAGLASSPSSQDYPQLFTPKRSLDAALSSPPTSKTPVSPGFEPRHAPAAVSLSKDPLVLEIQNSSRTSFSSSQNAKDTLCTPEHVLHAFHHPSPAKSSILRTAVTQEQVYSQPFIY
ncbi:LAFA_0F10440g1_1 [Lachancea sp. 'fantastica']|nr:LAFA_0F10440g1_1 [Lachancea sp. 'fantastica']